MFGRHCDESRPRPRAWHLADSRFYRRQRTGAWVVGFEGAEGVDCAGGTWEMMNRWKCTGTEGNPEMRSEDRRLRISSLWEVS